MHSALPLWDSLLWLRFLAAAAVVVWLPGWLLAGRWLVGLDRASRFVVSAALGLVLPFLFHAGPGRLGVDFQPSSYLLFAAGLGLGLGFWPRHRSATRSWTDGVAPLSTSTQRLAVLAAILVLGALIIGFGDLPVPPHVHDAANHAWMTRQVVELQSLDPAVLDHDPMVRLLVGYLPGLHAVAALISRVGGVAPYVSVWMLALSVCALVPLAWTLLWRLWGVPVGWMGIAVLLPVFNQLGPGGVMGWGGFGQVVGFFVVPLGAVALAAAWRDRSPYLSLLTGVILGGIAYLHASEILVVVGALFLVPPLRSGGDSAVTGPAPVQNRTWWSAGCLLSGVLFICGPEVWYLGSAYRELVARTPLETKEFADALERLTRAGGRELIHQALFVLVWCLGWRHRALRRITLASIGLGVFYLALQVFADPVTTSLSRPFYSQAPRILYLQFYLLPPLMAWLLMAGYRRLEAVRGRGIAGAVLAGALAWMLVTGLVGGVRNYSNSQSSVPFTVDDYEHAIAMRGSVEPGAVVANLEEDGSTWAAQVSGLRFVHPFSWNCVVPGLGDPAVHIAALSEDPWPAETRRLLGRLGVQYLYVSDGVYGQRERPRRGDFAEDPRFQPLLGSAQSTLYRIRVSGVGGEDD